MSILDDFFSKPSGTAPTFTKEVDTIYRFVTGKEMVSELEKLRMPSPELEKEKWKLMKTLRKRGPDGQSR